MAHNTSTLVGLPSSTPAAPLYAIYFLPLSSVLHDKSLAWLFTTIAVIATLLIMEQVVWRYKKGGLPGDAWTIPVIGKFKDSMSPSIESYQKQWSLGDLSALSVFNIFIVMASSNEFARKILNSPTYAEPCLVHSAKQILRADNWVFLTGKDHVEYRRGLNTLFTRKALGFYVSLQEAVARKHISRWLAESKANPGPRPVMMDIRYCNMETSLRVFCGSHIPEEAVKDINAKYWAITKSLQLVNFPFAFPGTNVWNAIQGRKAAMKWLELAAHKSKKAMASGAEPECMLDQWVHSLNEPSYKGRKEFSDVEMAMVLFSFLFASQDAMSSGLVFAFQHLADHPDILAKVRAEQERIRQGNYETPLTYEMMEQMTYLHSVVKESLRIRPPVTMVPYRVTRAFPIKENYKVPSNSMVIPSFYNSLHDPEVYPKPDDFIPERWLDPAGAANSNPKNYLVYGSGPHRCIGNEYANMNIALVLATGTVMMDFEHDQTALSDKIDIIATIFPKDGCRLTMTPRKHSV